MIRKLLALSADLLFPPRCAACGKLLAPLESRVLCEECGAQLARECITQCEQCFLPMHTCRCVPQPMAKRGIRAYIKLAPYGDKAGHSVAARMVLSVKKHPNKRLFRFLAAELAIGVKAAIAADERTRAKEALPPLDTVVAFLPRNRAAVRRYGLDQAALLAKALARELDYPFTPLLRRAKDTAPQKTLSAKARAQNLANAFEKAAHNEHLRVVLVDDIVTTGAGMAEAAKVLENTEIFAVSVAFTEKRGEK